MRLLGGALRKMIGAKELELPGATLGALLTAFVERGGEPIARRVYSPADPGSRTQGTLEVEVSRMSGAEGQALDRDLRLLVNGRNALFLDGLDTKLEESDVVTVHFAGSRAFPGG